MLLILITEFSLSCYQAAKVLNIPYTNAKVILKVFRSENRVISNSQRAFRPDSCRDISGANLLKSYPLLRSKALQVLTTVLESNLLSGHYKEKIFDQNFDVLSVRPLLESFKKEGRCFMGDYLRNEHGRVKLPQPEDVPTSLPDENGQITTGKLREVQCSRLEYEEKESMAKFMF